MRNFSLPTLVFAVLLSVPLTLIVHHWLTPVPRFASVDIKSLVKTYSQSLAHLNLSDEVQAQRARAFSQELEVILMRYSQENNVALLVEPAVISGIPSITKEVQRSVPRPLIE